MCCQRCSMGLPATAGSSRHKGARGYALALGTQSPISKGGLWSKVGKNLCFSLGLFFARLDRLLMFEQAKPVPASTAEQRITHGHMANSRSTYTELQTCRDLVERHGVTILKAIGSNRGY